MKKLLMILGILLLTVNAWGAESCVQTLEVKGDYQVLQMVWTTDGSGNFTATETAYDIDGYVLLAETIPSGTAAPTANYDITLRNSQGIGVFGESGAVGSEAYDGSLANLSATVPNMNQPLRNSEYEKMPVLGPLTLDVLNAGNDKSGTIRIHFVRMGK